MSYKSNYSNEAAIVNQSEAIEVDNISKNGRCLKNLMSRKNIINFSLTLFFMVSLALGLTACDNTNAQGSNSNSKVSVRWEYKITRIYINSGGDGMYTESIAAFNELGKEGWEYVGFSEIGNGYSNGHIFKRRLP